ncbi:hypothetical protein UA32_12500 [Photobacterium angustum]|uniref:Uncharacterized protein n=1 Tax=Photobacterium angustum TaxID=661 RepID=A0ABX5H120_PHOAN|nr:hypothetical protein UA32_12500 [Photobacterium angustum]PSX07034.1 hypothetical protein C0W27_15815 [Photobacterium angustum]
MAISREDVQKFLFRLEGVVFRGHDPRWSFSSESGEGARRNGGRFNPKVSTKLIGGKVNEIIVPRILVATSEMKLLSFGIGNLAHQLWLESSTSIVC